VEPVAGGATVPPGVVAGLRGELLEVGCGGGTRLGIARLQRPGGRPLAAADFVNGERLGAGDRFA
jgi:methionyl-tRNA formyltransferase